MAGCLVGPPLEDEWEEVHRVLISSDLQCSINTILTQEGASTWLPSALNPLDLSNHRPVATYGFGSVLSFWFSLLL
jgi:hypothetical protein